MKTKAPTYHGPICRRGHGTLRYVSGGACVVCQAENAGQRWRTKGITIRAQRREKYHTPEGRKYRRAQRYAVKYGITLEDYARMAEEQMDRCAICGTIDKLHVDHDHKSGKVRGLLCAKCNVGLGSFRDDPLRLELAAEYLRARL